PRRARCTRTRAARRPGMLAAAAPIATLTAVSGTRNRLLAREQLAQMLQRVGVLGRLVVADARDARKAKRETGAVRRAALQVREQHLDDNARRDEHGRSFLADG